MNQIVYKSFSTNRRFGVELEASNTVSRELINRVIVKHSDHAIKNATWAQSKNNNYWHVKQDASCGIECFEKGWEIASYVGSGYQDALHMAEVAEALRQSGVEVNESCGLHIHVEVKDFTSECMGVLLGHYAKFEWALSQALPIRRVCNSFCDSIFSLLSISDYFLTAGEMFAKLFPDNLSPHNNVCRWRSVNIVNFVTGSVRKSWTRKTVEFRMPEGSLFYEDVVNWVRFFVHFVEWVRCRKMPVTITPVNLREALIFMGLGHEEGEFSLLSSGLFATKVWLLKRILLYGRDKYCKIDAKQILNEMLCPVENF